MKYIKMFRFLNLIFLASICLSNQQSEKFKIANIEYKNTNYLKAIKLYEEIIKDGWHSGFLYYNLGNAYYRNGMIGQAIWAYNRGINLNPRFENIKYNLEIAKAKIKDRVTLPSEYYPVKIYMDLKFNYTFIEWFFICGISVLITVCLFVISKVLMLESLLIRRLVLILGFLTFIFHLITLDIFLEKNKQVYGIIIYDSVDAFSGPFYGDNTRLFTVNEGTKAIVSQKQGEWVEIVIFNGDKAWIPSDKIRTI